MPLTGVGSVVTPHFSLLNVYFIPKLRLNLVSVGQLFQKLIEIGRRENRLYILDELKVPVVAAATTVDLSFFRLSNSSSSFYLWHSCLGYVSSSRLRFLASVRALEN